MYPRNKHPLWFKSWSVPFSTIYSLITLLADSATTLVFFKQNTRTSRRQAREWWEAGKFPGEGLYVVGWPFCAQALEGGRTDRASTIPQFLACRRIPGRRSVDSRIIPSTQLLYSYTQHEKKNPNHTSIPSIHPPRLIASDSRALRCTVNMDAVHRDPLMVPHRRCYFFGRGTRSTLPTLSLRRRGNRWWCRG